MIGYRDFDFDSVSLTVTVMMLIVAKSIDGVDNSHWKIMGSKDETYLEAKKIISSPILRLVRNNKGGLIV